MKEELKKPSSTMYNFEILDKIEKKQYSALPNKNLHRNLRKKALLQAEEDIICDRLADKIDRGFAFQEHRERKLEKALRK